MKAQSDIYISLQKLYKQKARKDADDVLRRAQSSIQQGSISLNEVELFCTNARFIKLINSAEKRSVDMEQIAGESGSCLSLKRSDGFYQMLQS